MTKEKTFILIKPEAFNKRKEIKEYIIKNTNLKISESRVVKLKESDIECIYVNDLKTPLMLSIKKHLIGKLVEVCVIEGQSAIQIIWDLVGKHFDGNKCEANTLRYLFGRLGEIKYFNDEVYCLNAIHKTTGSEVDSVMKWFYREKSK